MYALGTGSAISTVLEPTKSTLSGAKLSNNYSRAGNPFNTGFHTFGPEVVYDMLAAIFQEDDNYTITGWLENEDDEQISPWTSITFSVANKPNTDEAGLWSLGRCLQPGSRCPLHARGYHLV